MDNKKSTKMFFIITFTIITLIVLVLLAGCFIMLNPLGSSKSPSEIEATEITTSETTTSSEVTLFGKVPDKTFFAVYGVDKNEALADVILVACFDKNAKTINTISIPRDTYVVIDDKYRQELKDLGLWTPSNGIKINAVHSYAGEYGNEYLTKIVEDILGVNIDYYFEVNLEGFNKIVDAIGGVEIDIPTRMYYSDPTQGLLINLKPGLQVLTGEQAQGFVRFRQYFNGDIDRIEMQKIFLKAFFEQVLNKETIMENATDFASTFLHYVNTNMKFTDSLKYIQFLNALSSESLTMETLPGAVTTPFRYDEEKTQELVNRLFFDIHPEETTEEYSEAVTDLSYE